MTNKNPPERWWERVPRIVGGWGFAILIFFRFPFPEAHMEDGEVVHLDPGLVPWGIYVGLILFSIGVAHSTVTGIVLGQIGRAWSFARRGGRDRRSGVTPVGLRAANVPAVDRRKGKQP